MALAKQVKKSAWHLWVRLAGLTGLLIAGIGLAALAATGQLWAIVLAIAGGVLVALALLVELKTALELVISRRGAVGSNVALQVVLAAVLIAGLNAYSFFHHLRFDWTRDGEFTIEHKFQEQLSQLRGETRIIVLQRHTSFGQQADKQDNYDAAAERQIVAKVKDLAEQFQELGPRFRVEVFDTQEEGFQDKLAKLKREAPALAEAIDKAPENSIFFYGRDKVQRLSFHDIYQLDKVASQEANDKLGNLVLRYQGIGPFANKVLNLEEKSPRLGVAVVHPILGLESDEEQYGMAGAKKSLTARSFHSQDIILKKSIRPPEPVVFTYNENMYDRLEVKVAALDKVLKNLQERQKDAKSDLKLWSSASLAEINKKYVIVVTSSGGGRIMEREGVEELIKGGRKLLLSKITEEVRTDLVDSFQEAISDGEKSMNQRREEREELVRKKNALNVENLDEQRRITDLRAKFKTLLADTDLLIVPRLTLLNAARRGELIPNQVHSLDDAQIGAIKDFLGAGKPVLFCLGPTNMPQDFPPDLQGGGDRLEFILGELGFKLPRQTILFDVESPALAEKSTVFDFLVPQAEMAKVPPVQFDWSANAGQQRLKAGLDDAKINPIRVSMRLAARGVGKNQPLEFRLRNPRPVYYSKPDRDVFGLPDKARVRPVEAAEMLQAVFMRTSNESWNDNEPFPTTERIPHYEPPKKKDSHEEPWLQPRKDYFPLGVAMETAIPSSWKESGQKGAAKVRVAVIGHGGVFLGQALSPAREKLLLDVCNWLLGRDDLLAKDNQTWEFPRVALTDNENALLQWGTRLGMPVLFIYIGLVVLMVRRMR